MGANTVENLLDEARTAFAQREWTAAFESFARVDGSDGLRPADLEVYATTAYMLNRISLMLETFERAHRGYLESGDTRRAARVASWLAFNLASRAKFGPATGWVRRASLLLDSESEEVVEHGYVWLPQIHQCVFADDFEGVAKAAEQALQIGLRFDDPDLVALASHAKGRSHLRLGRISEGLAVLDEVMVSVINGELSPQVTGIVYCSVIEGCYEVQEVRRSRDWTVALSRWCDGQPDLVAFTDQCLAHRAEIRQMEGRWSEALAEAGEAHARNERGPVAARASYQRGEIHRLRGDYIEAEKAYRQVSEGVGDPYPGLALLRLAQGSEDAAAASIRRALGEATSLFERARLLPAFVEIMVAHGDLQSAQEGCQELTALADQSGIRLHEAAAETATGLFEVRAKRASAALGHLRAGLEGWLEIEVPYEAARTRVLLAEALNAMGDVDAASIQLDSARDEFARLGAAPDLARLEMTSAERGGSDHGLTPREMEVLRLLAQGGTNRSIATELVLSERTVDRHVSNILTKLGVSTRTAATAFAFQNRLI